jgi:hypothetical protein
MAVWLSDGVQPELRLGGWLWAEPEGQRPGRRGGGSTSEASGTGERKEQDGRAQGGGQASAGSRRKTIGGLL